MKVFARFALTAFSALFILAAAALVALATIDLDDYRAPMADYLSGLAGSRVTVGGPIAVSVYPRLGIIAHDLSLQSTGDVEKRPLIKAAKAVFAVDVLALFERRLVFDRIILHQPEIAVTLDANNVGNWEGLFPEQSAPPAGNATAGAPANGSSGPSRAVPAPVPAPGAPSFLADWLGSAKIVLSGFTIKDGILRWRDDTIQESFRFEHIELTAGAGHQFPFDLSFIFRSESLQMRAAAHATGTGILDLEAPSIRLVGAALQAKGEMPLLGEITPCELEGRLFFDPFAETLKLENAVFTTADYRITGVIGGERIFRRSLLFQGSGTYLDKPSPLAAEAHKKAGLDPLSFDADFFLGIHNIRLENLVARTPKNPQAPLRGTLDFLNWHGPVLRGDLHADRLDLDAVFSDSADPADAGPPPWLVPPRLATADLDLTVSANATTTRGLASGPVTARLTARDGRADLALNATAVRRAARPGPRDTPLARALRDAAFDARIRASGPATSWQDMARDLKATANLELSRGSVYLPRRAAPLPLDRGALSVTLTGRPGRTVNLRNAPFDVAAKGTLSGEETWASSLAGVAYLDFGGGALPNLPDLRALTDAAVALRFDGEATRLGLDALMAANAARGGAAASPAQHPRVGARAAATVRLNVDTGVLRLADASLSCLGLTVRGSAEIRDVFRSPIAFGDLTVAPFAPRDLLRRLGHPRPEVRDDSFLAQARLSSLFQADAGGARFDDLKVTLDAAGLAGTASISRWDDPLLKFALAATPLDLDGYLPPKKDEDGPVDGKATAEKERRKPWDISFLRAPGLRLEGSLTVARVTWRKLAYDNVAATVRLSPGLLELFPFKASFYGGAITASLRAKADETLAVQGEVAANGFNLEPVMRRLFDDDHLGGTAHLSVSYNTHGLTPHEVRSHMGGTASFTVTDGFYRFYGENRPPAAMGGSASSGTVPGMAAPAGRSPGDAGGKDAAAGPQRKHLWSAVFSKAHGTFKAENGVISNDDFLMESLLAQAKGSGSADLGRETVDYLLNVQMTGIPTFPVHVHGSLNKPHTDIQAAGMITDTAERIGGSVFGLLRGVLTLPFKAIEKVTEPILNVAP
ncbi:MAG: AsmA family protein [Desulfovibrionaceae bacterium]|jgi:hypothetical protein|nr:AsmA family protein [Desulfovibrionaceae bacterium]